MYIKNREEHCKIPISVLNFSTRTFNCLMCANISTLYLLIENIENLEEIRNMGSRSGIPIRRTGFWSGSATRSIGGGIVRRRTLQNGKYRGLSLPHSMGCWGTGRRL